jgi:hypothetical protein
MRSFDYTHGYVVAQNISILEESEIGRKGKSEKAH